MPPKAKFTRDEIIQTGLDIVRENGMEALSARTLGTKLGSSARPIFTVFQSMEEVQEEVKKSAKLLYAGYVKKGLEQELAFKGVGAQYILFAMQEPKLFQLLFMTEQKEAPVVASILSKLDDNYEEILLSVQNGYNLSEDKAPASCSFSPLHAPSPHFIHIFPHFTLFLPVSCSFSLFHALSPYEEILLSVQNGYNLSEDKAEQLYRHLWIYTHGIAVLCATNMCIFTAEEINKMIVQVKIIALSSSCQLPLGSS